MPVLYVNGKPLAQSGSIVRYLAKKFGLAGSNDWEAALIDSVYEVTNDVTKNFMAIRFGVKD